MDEGGRTELHYAAMENDVGKIEALTADGLSPNSKDKQGFTPLHFAAQEYAVEAARTLLELGATVDAVNRFGNTALSDAVYNSRGRGDLILLLRAHGADPLRANRFGQTPVGLSRLIATSDVRRYFTDVPE